MSTSTRLISPAILSILVTAAMSSAAIVPISGVQAGVNGKPAYMLESLTVGDFTISRESLALGASTGSALLGSSIRHADDFELNTVATRNASGIWRVTKIGGLDSYSDTNGEAPDFFVFDAGMNDHLSVQAILTDGTIGKAVVIPAGTWGDTGLDIVGILNGGQSIGGLAFSITDLLDSQGRPLASTTVIHGLLFNSPHVDPVHFSAAKMVPEPATGAILVLGSLLMIRRRV